MDKTAFIILIIITTLLGGGIIYFHTINNVPVEDLMGIDGNSNGVRDDVEDWINQNYSDPMERGALMQYSRHVQLEILSHNNPSESARLARENNHSGCVYYVFDDIRKAIEITDKLDEVILNTAARRAAYDQYNRNIPGGAYYLPEDSINSCEFKGDTVAKTDNISDWKTFRSEEYGFEFKYPEGWPLNEGHYANTKSEISISITKPTTEKYPDLWIGVDVYSNPDNLSLQKWLELSDEYYSKSEIDDINKENGPGIQHRESFVSILGQQVLQIYTTGEGGWDRNTFISKDGKIYVISIGSEVDLPYEQENSIYDKILSTFKFIEPSGFTKIKEDQRYVYYSGSATISGDYSEILYPTIGSGILCFTADDKTAHLIPREEGDSRVPWFCFKDQVKAKSSFGVNDKVQDVTCKEIVGSATITISNYVVDKLESEVYDTADLVNVSTNDGPRTITVDDPGCKL